ncbi:hypothetical protein AEA09_16875 [Lysinibacillus contaminans]|uniref:IDEAL domain-containing protein n=1 Tax=Lysinibacillus contaminans TaxID=1293441 RepID=A0ABR5JW77_9BACI|nr:hypothetical protein [Lysinibacillus contaminans]KOS66421.1 hypothetical protein AEA09_16875 [Lysinibacillus contaminans]
MSYLDKHLARTLEQQHKRTVRGLFLKIQDLNNECTILRKRIEEHIDLTQYHDALDYVNKYVVHTTILNLKFITNSQNLEVVVLHSILIEFILTNETAKSFDYEKQLLEGYIEEILALNDHAPVLFANHKEKMLQYITSQTT